jgi:hypothetical protein
MKGKCKLCLIEGVELQASHFLPAAIYRSMRGNPSKGNPNPWAVTPNSAHQTSRQVKAPLLCKECEQRFSKNGEHWVFTNGLKNDGTFPLAATLASHVPYAQEPGVSTTKVYHAAEIPEINISALSYFAASMFWRGSAYPWKADGTCPVPLGPYQEPLRQYLMGMTGFPPDVALAVVVREPSGIRHLTHEPLGEWRGELFVAKFPMPGFAFSINAGKNMPLPLRRTCFVRGEGNPIVLSGFVEKHILDEGVRMINRGRRKIL